MNIIVHTVTITENIITNIIKNTRSINTTNIIVGDDDDDDWDDD